MLFIEQSVQDLSDGRQAARSRTQPVRRM